MKVNGFLSNFKQCSYRRSLCTKKCCPERWPRGLEGKGVSYSLHLWPWEASLLEAPKGYLFGGRTQRWRHPRRNPNGRITSFSSVWLYQRWEGNDVIVWGFCKDMACPLGVNTRLEPAWPASPGPINTDLESPCSSPDSSSERSWKMCLFWTKHFTFHLIHVPAGHSWDKHVTDEHSKSHCPWWTMCASFRVD